MLIYTIAICLLINYLYACCMRYVGLSIWSQESNHTNKCLPKKALHMIFFVYLIPWQQSDNKNITNTKVSPYSHLLNDNKLVLVLQFVLKSQNKLLPTKNGFYGIFSPALTLMVTSLSGAEDQGGRAHYYRKIEYIFEKQNIFPINQAPRLFQNQMLEPVFLVFILDT